MKVLLTGGTGFIGGNLAASLANSYEICAPRRNELDLCDEAAVRDFLSAGHFDVVVHAATTRANRKLGAPSDILDRNCRMFFNLARNEALFGKMLYFGSGAEYDRRCMPPRVRERWFDTRVPADAYGFSKYICAKYTERMQNIYNLRLFGVFGKHEAWDVRFISNACCRVVQGMDITIRQDVAFDYLDVDDLAKLTAWFIEHEPRHKAYNVCRGRAVTLTELAGMVAEVSGRGPKIMTVNPGMGREYSGDNAQLMDELGSFEFRDLRDSVATLYRWYDENKHGIDPEQLRFDE